MPTVKVLVDYVGDYMAGDIVIDAPASLINIAIQETRNAATGELLAIIVDNPDREGKSADAPEDWEESMRNLVAELEASRIREAELKAKLEAAEGADDELKELKASAKELKIPGYTKMSADELKVAIAAAAGGGQGGQ